ncbi:hypothetical protein NDA16_003960 [Ustilago loliicola]|nr:hypothetical protein NDA16_003960 [Ustilago loliicola]
MTRYSGTNIEDRDDWLTKVQATLLRDSVRLDRDGPRAASMYLRGEAANWHQHTYWPIHKDDTPLSWNNFVKELKDRFFQEDKKGMALRIARQVAFEDLEQLLSTFANLNKLYPQRDIIEVTYDFAYKLPSTHSGLRDELVRQLPKDFQELWVRVRAWKGCQPRKIAA